MPRFKKPQPESGFTIIELLISVAILLVLASLAIFSTRTLLRQVEIDSTGQNILSTLRLARSKTLASEGETTYGVHFEADKYVLFSGSSYDESAAGNKEYTLNDTEVHSISLNGGPGVVDVIFDRVRGTTSQYGTVSLRLNADNNQNRTIHINSSGQVSYSDSTSSPVSRIKDHRHLHLTLGGDIRTKNQLTLDFPYDMYTEVINMAGYFSGGPPASEFNWSGTINVNGADQVLKIHTHSLSGFETKLCIHRNGNKVVNVLIDGEPIVVYDVDGVATSGFAPEPQ